MCRRKLYISLVLVDGVVPERLEAMKWISESCLTQTWPEEELITLHGPYWLWHCLWSIYVCVCSFTSNYVCGVCKQCSGFKDQLTAKMKPIWITYSQPLDWGQRRDHGWVVWLYFKPCVTVWGRSSKRVMRQASLHLIPWKQFPAWLTTGLHLQKVNCRDSVTPDGREKVKRKLSTDFFCTGRYGH